VKLHWRFLYRLGKPDTPGVVLRRVLSMLDPDPLVEVWLLGADPQRLLRAYPDLAPLRREDGTFASLDSRFQEWTPDTPLVPISATTLLGVVDGIPRRFPFTFATFYVPEVSWASVDPPPRAGTTPGPWPAKFPEACRVPIPGILLVSRRSPSRREVFLEATLPAATPEATDSTVRPVSDDIQQRLQTFGRMAPPELQVELEPHEIPTQAQGDQARALAASWNAGLPVLLARARHALPEVPSPTMGAGGLTTSNKPALVAAFRPRGWRYESSGSGAGAFLFSKRSPGGHRLTIFFDVGSWSRQCSGFINVSGPGWTSSFALACATGPRGQHYAIADDETWARAVENAAFVVDQLELTALPALEAIYPPSPPWFMPSPGHRRAVSSS
jgi:hypothetical protein